MIIDCHWHVYFDDCEKNIQRSITEMRRCKIDRCALMFYQKLYQNDRDLYIQGEALKVYSKRFENDFIPFLVIDPNVPFQIIEDCIKEYVIEGPAVAVKVHHSMKADRPEFEPLAKILSDFRIPVLIHCWYKTVQEYENESNPSHIATLAEKFPDLKIIMAHITGCRIRGMQEIEKYPNVYVDTSGSQPEDGLLQYGLDYLGAERILYGSDFPGRDPATQIGRIFSVDMCQRDRDMILYGNAVKLFRGCFQSNNT